MNCKPILASYPLANFHQTRDAARQSEQKVVQSVGSSSVEPALNCNSYGGRQKNVALLESVFRYYGRSPIFVVRTAISTSVSCLGQAAAMYEIKRLAFKYKVDLGAVQFPQKAGQRLPAQATKEQQNAYLSWANAAATIGTVANGTRVIGYGALAASGYNPTLLPKAAVVSKAASMVANFLDDTKKGLDIVATRYARALYTGHYDTDEVRARMAMATTPEAKREAVIGILKEKAATIDDFEKLGDVEKFKALERAGDNGIRYAVDIDQDLQKTKEDVNFLARDLTLLSQDEQKLKRSFMSQNEVLNQKLNVLSQQLEDSGQHYSPSQAEYGQQFRFLLDLNENKMTAQQKITAIEQFNWGDFPNDTDGTLKQRRIEHLKIQAEVEGVQSKVQMGVDDLAGVRNILAGIGIHSPDLDNAVKNTQGVEKGVNAVAALASGNYIGGAMQVIGMFGGGSDDPAAAQNAAVMAALGQIMELQRKTIELQKKTMEMIENLSKQMNQGFQVLDYHVAQVLRLQSFSWINTYYERLVAPIQECRDFKNHWRSEFLTFGMDERRLRSSKMSEPLSSNSEETYLTRIVEQNEPFPVMSMSQWQLHPLNVSEYQKCYENVNSLTKRLFTFLDLKNVVAGASMKSDPLFSLESGEIAANGPDMVRVAMDQQQDIV